MTDDPLREIAALRERLRSLEAIAAATPPRAPLGEAIADIYNPPAGQPPVDPARRALEARAHGFVPDQQSEAGLLARAKDPERYDRELRAMGGDPLALSLYARGRQAAIELGRFTPDTPKEGAK